MKDIIIIISKIKSKTLIDIPYWNRSEKINFQIYIFTDIDIFSTLFVDEWP